MSIQEVQQTKTKRRPRYWVRAMFALLATVLVLGCIAPFINAASFSGRIRQALESSLGRKVEFNEVHFTLFSGPGFSLEDVVIGEDPQYGLEPFAYVPTLKARVRLDKLLFGEMRFSSLRLVGPSLNLVKRSDGTWNVVELVTRLTAPRRTPLNLFPAFEVSDGRLDFKFGTRKTTLYMADTDLTIYPARSGKIYVEFSGSPARTDRAGNGFGHLRGSFNWLFKVSDRRVDEVEGDVTLDPSNLSELTTLFQGHDIGVHGTVSTNAHIEGPAQSLQITGELRLEDVHRWDLLSSHGEDWRIRYRGALDLLAHRLDLNTTPSRAGESTPVSLRVRVNDFLASTDWSVFASLNKAPLEDLLPLAKRMGLALPQGASLNGSLNGVIGYSSTSGIQGGVAINDAVATLPNVPPLRTAIAHVTISGTHIHFDPAALETDVGGTLQAGGDYYSSVSRADAFLETTDFPVSALKNTIAAWFGPATALEALAEGEITGELSYSHNLAPAAADANLPVSWSGQFQFANASLRIPGLAVPLAHSQGSVVFDAERFTLDRFSARMGQAMVHASYRYNLAAKRPEFVRVELPSANLAELETALSPAFERDSILARLRLRRAVPDWLAARNVEGDLLIDQFSIDQVNLGPLTSHFIWQGTNLQLGSLQLKLTQGLIRAKGAVNLASYSPQLRLDGTVAGFLWGGGMLNAEGRLETTGTGVNILRNVRSSGTFDGRDIQLGANNSFDQVSGAFDFAFADGSPNLRLSNVQALQNDDSWTGSGASTSEGKLILDLTSSGRQLHLVNSISPEAPSPASPDTGAVIFPQ